MNILISGFCGKMGQTVYNCAKKFEDIQVVEGVDRQEVIDNYEDKNLCLMSDINNSKKCDVVVDFSHFSVLPKILDFCIKNKKPLVLATTGLSKEDEIKIKEASKIIPIFKSSNMSEGVFVFLNLIKNACSNLLGWDIEIIEKHHNCKIDSPSGTSFMMAKEVENVRKNINLIFGRDRFSKKRNPQDVAIHSVRGGGVVGEHEINFFNENEVITISHEAFSKSIFATGALKAARFIEKQKPGLYQMKNLFE